MIERVAEYLDPNCPWPWDIHTQHAWLSVNIRVYYEVGVFDTGGFLGIHFFHFFDEFTWGNGANQVMFTEHNAPNGCGVTESAGAYYNFSITWWWAGLWTTDIDCGGCYQSFSSHDFAQQGMTFSYEIPRTEFERFPNTNSFYAHQTWLTYRDINTMNWYFWQGMYCPTAQTLGATLARESSSAWHLDNNGASC